jgi:hypothetical protein
LRLVRLRSSLCGGEAGRLSGGRRDEDENQKSNETL